MALFIPGWWIVTIQKKWLANGDGWILENIQELVLVAKFCPKIFETMVFNWPWRFLGFQFQTENSTIRKC